MSAVYPTRDFMKQLQGHPSVMYTKNPVKSKIFKVSLLQISQQEDKKILKTEILGKNSLKSDYFPKMQRLLQLLPR